MKDLTDELVAKEVLKWKFDPAVGWRTRANTIERYLPSFKTDGRWTGLLWNIALPIMQKNHIGLAAGLMDDTWGYPSSFLEECFGGLVHKYGKDLINVTDLMHNLIVIIVDSSPLLN
ncbi:STAS-like domain-containing protein [Leptospira santarosai]|uniref:STAS-like domain-containing protein n=1 Tax=Leptospira santarosai TaxID=28183 RepID=UPI0007733E44|nr:DUF4325 domain-containing protein [Leptospira santarosai]MDI7195470.1 DUF4325 domain-containing protein [Leptospira santarosai]MDI7203595.1 DUF4325 domain-containing protein [Leptospira santarosai]